MNHQAPLDFEGQNNVRCIQQVSMLKLWQRLRGNSHLPAASAVRGDDLERLREKLMLLEVEWHDGEPRYLIRFQGTDFTRMHDRYCVGLYLNDIMAPAVRERGLQTYRQVVDQQIPAFNSTPVRDDQGAVVNYERLLLPFAIPGQEGVGQIYSVITLFTEDNVSPFETMRGAAPAAE